MTKLYKLTTQGGYTCPDSKNSCLWGQGVTHTASGIGGLCTDGVIHAYLSPELAILLNPIHANYHNPRLWEASGKIVAREGQLKVGCRSLTTVREIDVPEISLEQRVGFAILCASAVFNHDGWNYWARRWLSGRDRLAQSARDVAGELAFLSDRSFSSSSSSSSSSSATVAWGAAGAAEMVPLAWGAAAKGCVARGAAHVAYKAFEVANGIDLVALAREAVDAG